MPADQSDTDQPLVSDVAPAEQLPKVETTPPNPAPLDSASFAPAFIQNFAETPAPSIRTGEVLTPAYTAQPDIGRPDAVDPAARPPPTPTAVPETLSSATAAALLLDASDSLEPPHQFSKPDSDLPEGIDDPISTQESVYNATPAPAEPVAEDEEGSELGFGFDEDFGPRPTGATQLPMMFIWAGVLAAMVMLLIVVVVGWFVFGGNEPLQTTPTVAVIEPPPKPVAAPAANPEAVEATVEDDLEAPPEPSRGEPRAPSGTPEPEPQTPTTPPKPSGNASNPWGADAPPAAAPEPVAPKSDDPAKKKGMFKRKK